MTVLFKSRNHIRHVLVVAAVDPGERQSLGEGPLEQPRFLDDLAACLVAGFDEVTGLRNYPQIELPTKARIRSLK